MQPERDYEVGYGRPPKHGQFKPRHSGNPKGRPRKSKMLDAILGDVLDEKVTFTENGRRRKTNKAEAMCKSLVNDAVKGDKRATQMVLRAMEAFARLKTPKTRPAKPQPAEPSRPSGVVVLPHNDRDPLDPELVAEYARVKGEYEARKARERQDPANENCRKEEVA
jgi:Family of unknown function (DUF5681)